MNNFQLEDSMDEDMQSHPVHELSSESTGSFNDRDTVSVTNTEG